MSATPVALKVDAWVAGTWHAEIDPMPIVDVDDGSIVALATSTSPTLLQEAIAAAKTAAPALAALPSYSRREVLLRAAARVESERSTFAQWICREGVKTIREAELEAARCVRTLRLCAGLADGPLGETLPLDTRPGLEGRIGAWFQRPSGTVVAITPYNDPLNLVAHKIGPAIAVGAPVILKPHESTPVSAYLLVKTLLDCGLHPAHVQLVPGDGTVLGPLLCGSPDTRVISFTGGQRAGQAIARVAGVKKLLLELGGICPTIVMPSADLNVALQRIVSGAFWAAGQNCLHVQRVLVHEQVFDSFRERVVEATKRLRQGLKSDPRTDVGPLRGPLAIEHACQLLSDAKAHGGTVLCGGRPNGAGFEPTWVELPDPTGRLINEEAFCPISTLEPVSSMAQALARASWSGSAVQAGVFTNDLEEARQGIAGLDAGAVLINECSDFRDDAMPFGGPGSNGLGREGVRFAAQAYSEPKLVCLC